MGEQQKFTKRKGKLLSIFVVLGLISACTDRTSEDSQSTEVEDMRLEETKQSVFRVAARSCEESSNKTATAFAVDEKTLLSVAHTFEDTQGFTVKDSLGKQYPATLLLIDKEKDLALINISEPLEHFLKITDEPQNSDKISFVTYVEDHPSLKTAELLQVATVSIDDEHEKEALEIKAPIESGDSGSPVINQDAQLIGMVFATSKSEEKGWALSSPEIIESLEADSEPQNLDCDS